MVLGDVLAVLIGVLLGALASVPVAFVIAVSVRRCPNSRISDSGAAWQQPHRDDMPVLDVPAVEAPWTMLEAPRRELKA